MHISSDYNFRRTFEWRVQLPFRGAWKHAFDCLRSALFSDSAQDLLLDVSLRSCIFSKAPTVIPELLFQWPWFPCSSASLLLLSPYPLSRKCSVICGTFASAVVTHALTLPPWPDHLRHDHLRLLLLITKFQAEYAETTEANRWSFVQNLWPGKVTAMTSEWLQHKGHCVLYTVPFPTRQISNKVSSRSEPPSSFICPSLLLSAPACLLFTVRLPPRFVCLFPSLLFGHSCSHTFLWKGEVGGRGRGRGLGRLKKGIVSRQFIWEKDGWSTEFSVVQDGWPESWGKRSMHAHVKAFPKYTAKAQFLTRACRGETMSEAFFFAATSYCTVELFVVVYTALLGTICKGSEKCCSFGWTKALKYLRR